MSAPPYQPLFRKEVAEQRTERLQGEVHIALPLSWQLIGFFMLAGLAVAIAFLVTASYARVETVSGAIVLDRGVAPILPSRPGIVTELAAREGQRVRAGDPLVRIRSEEDMAGGITAPERMLDALEQQDDGLASQIGLMRSAAAAEQSRLVVQIAGLRKEMASLEAQIAAQRRLVAVAENEYREVQGIAGRGFISRRDLEGREAALLVRRQQLSQLEQSHAAKSGSLAEAQRAMVQASAAAEASAASIQSSRAQVTQRLAEVESAQGYTLTSPIGGVVTAVTGRLGHPATPQQPLMVVLPADARPRAELYVPTSAAGFLAVGQEVRLAVDAFPYQRFGTVTARIVEISSAAVTKATDEGRAAVPVYLVTADLSRTTVAAFGRQQPLLPGMTLSARIVTEKQSLFEWLFEPVLAVRRR